MKTANVKLIALLLAMAGLFSCSSADNKSGKDTEVKTETGTASATDKADAPAPAATEGSGSTTTVTALKEMVNKDWKAVDGKTFTVKAFPVGMQKAATAGEFYLYMGDKKGDMSANFAGVFKEEEKEEVKKHKGDAVMTITGTLGTPNGMVVLKNAKIVE